jgi:hypothetical protein
MNKEMNKEKILNKLKKSCTYSNHISLPGNIDFHLNDNILNLFMSKDCVVKNMQENDAAFEGWSITIFRWLREDPGIEKISLSWGEPDDINNKHYQRFLYRVKNFNDMYSWFEIENRQYLDKLKLKFDSKNNYYINVSDKRDLKKIKNKLDDENSVESLLAARGINTINDKILKKENINYQLPVGVFDQKNIKDDNRIFPGGSSAIDLFGVESDTTYIFELKFNSKMIGIITQIYFYSMIIKDVQKNNLKPAEKNDHLDKIIKTYKLSAYMIADEYHPLIDNEVIDLMNEGVQGTEFKALKFIINQFDISHFDRS